MNPNNLEEFRVAESVNRELYFNFAMMEQIQSTYINSVDKELNDNQKKLDEEGVKLDAEIIRLRTILNAVNVGREEQVLPSPTESEQL